MFGLLKHSKVGSFRSNHGNCVQPQPSSFELISAMFVLSRLLTVFSISLEYGASQLRKSYFLSSVSACFASQLPEQDLLLFSTFLSFY